MAIGDARSRAAFFIILALALSLVFLAGCPIIPPKPPENETWPEFNESNVTPPQQNETPGQNLSTEPCQQQNVIERDGCYKDLAAKHSDFAYCTKVYQVSERDRCMFMFANTSSQICVIISTGTSLRDDCFDMNARKEMLMELCDRIADQAKKEACITAVSPACSLESDGDARTTCLAFYHKNYSYCISDNCLYEYGISRSDREACGAIAEEAPRLACLSVVTDTDYCAGAKYDATRDLCYQKAAYEDNYIPYCMKITDLGAYRSDCYSILAVLNMNMSLCKRPAQENERNICYKNYSVSTGDQTACAEITWAEWATGRDSCYLETALKYNRPPFCNEIENIYGRNTCYSQVINSGSLLTTEDCDSLTDAGWKDVCHTKVAVQQNNVAICKEIENQQSKLNCLEKFGE